MKLLAYGEDMFVTSI